MTDYKIIQTINGPEDVKKLSMEQLEDCLLYTSNLENDVIGKYVEKLLGIRKNEEEKKESGSTMEFLEEFGF